MRDLLLTIFLIAGCERDLLADLPDGGDPELVWTPCMDRLECTSVAVPTDGVDPASGTLELPVARLRAATPADRLGTLVYISDTMWTGLEPVPQFVGYLENNLP